MTDDSAEFDAVARLGEEFLARHRRGEPVDVAEYVAKYPHLAKRLERLFPVMQLADEFRPPSTSMPARLGEYRLIRELGRGGMGVVYEAVQEPLGRHVALKVLAGGPTCSASFRARFQREARAAARLQHPNIVPVYGGGEADGTLYYAMHYIAGRGLDAVLHEMQRQRGQAKTQAGMRTPDQVIAVSAESATTSEWPQTGHAHSVARIGLQVAQALAYAHEQGVQHRDIKPSNLLVDAVGTVWVADFGLARADDDDNLTQTGELVGTLRYMAPERFRNESTPAGDIYALGATLYELLTLRPAFTEADRARLMHQILTDEPPAPRQLDDRIPRDLETIVLRAMAKEPGDRYRSAAALAEDLRLFAADEPIRARRPPLVERAWRWCRRNPRVAGLLALAAALLLVIVIGSPLMTIRLAREKALALQQLWKAQLAEAAALRTTHEAGRRFAGLTALDAAAALRDRLPVDADRDRTLGDHYLAALALADLRPAEPRITLQPGDVALTFDVQLTRYARGTTSGAITVHSLTGAVLTALPAVGIDARGLKFSPDGRYLAAGYHGSHRATAEKFRVWDLDTTKAVVTIDVETGCGVADFSPDGRHVAYSVAPQRLVDHDLTTGAVRHSELSGLANAIAWHPDGDRLAVAVKRTVEVRALDGAVIWTQRVKSDCWALAWHPDGKQLACGSGAAIELWLPGATTVAASLRGHDNLVYALTFSHGGRLLASKANDGSARLWDTELHEPLVRAAAVYSGCVPLLFGPDDRRLTGGADGTVAWLWDVAHGEECRTWVAPGAGPRWLAASAAFHPDGRHVAVVGSDGLRVWDWATGCEKRRLPTPLGWSTAYLPDGRLLSTGRTGLQLWNDAAQVLLPEPVFQLSISSAGRHVIARPADGRARIIDLSHPEAVVSLPPVERLRYVALSADGKLAATGTEHGGPVQVWDAASGHLRATLAGTENAAVAFSPTHPWLVVGTVRDHVLYDVVTWQVARRWPKEVENIPVDVSFTSDGALLALRHGASTIHLVNPHTGVRLAELRTPGRLPIVFHALSPDGTKLLAGGYGPRLFAWDLQALRRELARRGVGW